MSGAVAASNGQHAGEVRLSIATVRSAKDNTAGASEVVAWSDLAGRLTQYDRRAQKDGPCWLPATLAPACSCGEKSCPGRHGHRIDANVREVFALVLDVDKLADDRAVDLVVDRLRDLGLDAVVHTSYSDGANGRRALRVVIPLDAPVEGVQWPAFWQAATEWLAIPCEPACKNPARIWFLPSCPPDRAPATWTIEGAPLATGAVWAFAERKALVQAEREWRAAPRPDPVVGGRLSIEERARRYVDTMAPAVSGQLGHQATFKVALALVRGFELDEGTALSILRSYNERCVPPWTERELEHKVRQAAASTKVPLGYLLDTPAPSNGRNGAGGTRPPPRDEDSPPEIESDEPGEVLQNGGKEEERRRAVWLGPVDIVSLIRSRARERWVEIGLGMSVIAEVRAGGLVTLCGPTGSGKTSLADGIAARFAREQGWAVIMSLELSADEMAARMIGMATDRSWKEVLRGELSDEEMLAALPARLLMIELNGLEALDAKLAELRAADAEVPLLFVVDYGQLVESLAKEQRTKVAGNWERAKGVAKRHRAVGLMLSQMSRPAARAARGGERHGVDAIDGGAESGAVEHWSSVSLEIGAAGAEDKYGRRDVQLNIAKGRMEGGDLVLPMSYEGRTGRWAVIGNPRPAAEVRAEKEARASEEKTVGRRTKLLDTVARHGPMYKDAAVSKAGGNADLARLLFDQAAEAGELVQVEKKKRGTNHWMWWTPAKAKEAGLAIVRQGDIDGID